MHTNMHMHIHNIYLHTVMHINTYAQIYTHICTQTHIYIYMDIYREEMHVKYCKILYYQKMVKVFI